MDSLAYLYVLLVCFTMAFHDGVEASRWDISAKEDLEFERQVKVLNKPFITTIRTDSEVIFDCVDFYKQPAFDYALLNNYTIAYEKPISLRNKLRDPLHVGTEGERCPIGTVPIKRITKEDLIREKRASQERTLIGNTLGAHHAVVRTKPGINKFVGAGGVSSVWNPHVSGRQYSAGRLKISNEGDSIEVGWRSVQCTLSNLLGSNQYKIYNSALGKDMNKPLVDPTLYGDTRSYLYIRTDAGGSHCFDARCGFVIMDTRNLVGDALTPISQHGGPISVIIIFIVQNTITGNWYLEYGPDHIQIGFWPKRLFKGLAKLGASAEWGGEVFSPLDTPKPAMGAGSIPPSRPDKEYDAFFEFMVLLDGQKTLNVGNLDSIADSKNYQVRDVGISTIPNTGHVMFYGGFANPTM